MTREHGMVAQHELLAARTKLATRPTGRMQGRKPIFPIKCLFEQDTFKKFTVFKN